MQYEDTAEFYLFLIAGIVILHSKGEKALKVNDFSRIRIGHAFRQRLERKPDGNVNIIQPKNITAQGLISFGDEPPFRTKAPVTRPLQPNDLLVVNRGRFAAAVFDLTEPGPWIVPSSILVLTVSEPTVLPEYLACYFNSSKGQRLFRRHCVQTTIPFISPGNLGQIDIPIPPVDRQRSLAALGKTIASHALLSGRKDELQRQILNHALMAGERSTRRRAE